MAPVLACRWGVDVGVRGMRGLVAVASALLGAPLGSALLTASGQHVMRCVGGAMVACADVSFARAYASVAVVASLAAAVRRLASNTMVVVW